MIRAAARRTLISSCWAAGLPVQRCSPHGEGVWADLIGQRFTKAAKRLGLMRNSMRFERMDFSRFRRPLIVPASGARQAGNATGQLDLF
jgi:hypothetical protein